MNFLVFACLTFSAVLYRAEGCCTPDQWEGHIGEIGGVARRSIFHTPKLIGGSAALSYDATNQKMASTVQGKEGSVRYVADYPGKKVYVIQSTTCKYYELTKPFKKMCTDNATAAGTTTFGAGGESLAVNGWSFQVKGLTGYATTTQQGCVPVSEAYFGKIERDYIVLTLGYYNITSGIKDPSIFNHPDSCEPGSGDIDSHLDELGFSQGTRLMTNKFNGEEPKSDDKYLRYDDKFNSINKI